MPLLTNGGSEGLPSAPVSDWLLQHPLRMELETHDKICAGIEVSFDQSIFRVRHRLEPTRQAADALMVVAVHAQTFSAVPALQRASGNDSDQMPVGVVMVVIDMLEMRPLFLLDVAVERAAADHIEQLRSPADRQDRNMVAKRVAQDPNLNLIFERVRFFEVL